MLDLGARAEGLPADDGAVPTSPPGRFALACLDGRPSAQWSCAAFSGRDLSRIPSQLEFRSAPTGLPACVPGTVCPPPWAAVDCSTSPLRLTSTRPDWWFSVHVLRIDHPQLRESLPSWRSTVWATLAGRLVERRTASLSTDNMFRSYRVGRAKAL